MNKEIFWMGFAMVLAPMFLGLLVLFAYLIALIEWTIVTLVTTCVGFYLAIAMIIMLIGIFTD